MIKNFSILSILVGNYSRAALHKTFAPDMSPAELLIRAGELSSAAAAEWAKP